MSACRARCETPGSVAYLADRVVNVQRPILEHRGESVRLVVRAELRAPRRRGRAPLCGVEGRERLRAPRQRTRPQAYLACSLARVLAEVEEDASSPSVRFFRSFAATTRSASRSARSRCRRIAAMSALRCGLVGLLREPVRDAPRERHVRLLAEGLRHGQARLPLAIVKELPGAAPRPGRFFFSAAKIPRSSFSISIRLPADAPVQAFQPLPNSAAVGPGPTSHLTAAHFHLIRQRYPAVMRRLGARDPPRPSVPLQAC